MSRVENEKFRMAQRREINLEEAWIEKSLVGQRGLCFGGH